MTYFELKDKSDEYFHKIVGINKLVFNEILNILLERKIVKVSANKLFFYSNIRSVKDSLVSFLVFDLKTI